MSEAPNKHTLHVVMQAREGALVRLLGLVERRGFRLFSVSTAPTDDIFNITLEVVSERDVGTLCRQILRLAEVVSATRAES